MKVGLLQIDGKMPNLALMKLAAWHGKRGDDVTVLDMSCFQFDRVYASKVFVGGSGVDLKSELPPEIEAQVPDYERFKTDYSIGFTSRGCIRDCGFCIVKEKEGEIREAPFDWISSHNVVLLDNNFLASPKWKEKLEYFIRQRLKVNFNQGIDIRLINEENATLLSQILYYDRTFRKRRLYFAFDDPRLESTVKKGIQILNRAGIPSPHLIFYILVGYNTTLDEDLHRVKVLKELGCLPYAMPYSSSPVVRKFTRWVNRLYYQIYSWEDYNSSLSHGKKAKEEST